MNNQVRRGLVNDEAFSPVSSQREGPRRAQRLDVMEARAGRRAIAPLAGKLMDWHRLAALLQARLSHAEKRGDPTSGVLSDINAVAREIEGELQAWRDSLDDVQDRTGRVSDAERSCPSILHGLAELGRRGHGAN